MEQNQQWVVTGPPIPLSIQYFIWTCLAFLGTNVAWLLGNRNVAIFDGVAFVFFALLSIGQANNERKGKL